MARKFLTAIDLSKNELQNAAVHNLAGAPSSPVKGQIYMNTTDNILYWWNGTAWISAAGGSVAFGAVPAETTFGIAKNDGVATTAARSDHTHGSPTHDNAAHSAIPLNALATATLNYNMGGNKITNIGLPINPGDSASKSYVDGLVQGLAWKDAVRVATTANITLSAPQTVDGVAVVAGDRVLVKNQSTGSQNGIYDVAAGTWTRSVDADVVGELEAAAVFVLEGSTNGDEAWVCTTNAPITPGTTATVWVQIAGAGAVVAGAGLTQAGTTLDVGAGAGITVDADAVRLADTNASTIKGRVVGSGVGPPVDLTAAQATAILDVFTSSLKGLVPSGGDSTKILRGDGTWFTPTYVRRQPFTVQAATSTTINHAFSTRDVGVVVYRSTTPWDTVEVDVERPDVDNVVVRFAVAPTAGEYLGVVFA